MELVLDAVVLAVLVIFAIRGYIKGFVRAVTGLIGGLLAFLGARVVAGIFTPPIAKILPFPGIGTKLASFIRSSFLGEDTGFTATQILKDYGLPDPVAEAVGGRVGDAVFTDSQQLLKSLADALDYYMTYIIVFILSFILLYILILLLSMVLDGIMHLPVLNLVNRLGGLFTGILGGLVLVFCITLLTGWLAPILDTLFDITINDEVIQRTVLFKLFANLNPLRYIF